jgi:hypothetical protein
MTLLLRNSLLNRDVIDEMAIRSSFLLWTVMDILFSWQQQQS